MKNGRKKEMKVYSRLSEERRERDRVEEENTKNEERDTITL